MIGRLALVIAAWLATRRLAYGTPSDPVGGTVITTAYAIANLLDPIRWLRAMTGNSDPPGSNYWLRSNSTTSVSWVDRVTEVRAAIAPTLVLPSVVGDKVGLYPPFAGIAIQTGRAILYRGGGIEWIIADDAAGTNPQAIWHAGNDGAGSQLDAGLFAGQPPAFYATAAALTAEATARTAADTAEATARLATAVPSGLIAAFPTAAAIASGWSRFTNGNGRLLVGAGTTFGQAFVEGASAGSSWVHNHGVSLTATAVSGGGTVQGGGSSSADPQGHTHPVAGSTVDQTWIPPSFTVVWAQKS